jgi:hypothetical protein
MKARNAGLLAGLFLLALCGPLAAHPSAAGHGYPAESSGSVTVWGAAYGTPGWSGSLSFGSPYAYAPGYIPWAAQAAGHRHVAQCNHGPRHGYASAWRQGYAHGRHDGYYGHGKHGRGHGHHD